MDGRTESRARRRLLTRVALVALCVLPQAVHAGQDTPPEETRPDARANELETIVVTATRREMNLQDVPASITALSERRLELSGADDFEDFSRQVAGLQLNQGAQNTALPVIRGISTSATLENTQATVATYVDDLPTLETFGAFATPDLRLFDVNRVEVLKGPQGTLFGSGAMGGAIRVITNKPDLTRFEGKAEGTISTTRHGEASYAANLMVNAPLVEDKLGFRAIAYTRRDGGFVDNPVRDEKDVNYERVHGGRFMLRARPSEDLTLTLTAIIQHNRPNDSPGVDANSRNFTSTRLLPMRTRLEMTTFNLVADYALDRATITSSTTYAWQNAANMNDLSGTVAQLYEVFGLPPAPPAAYVGKSDGKFFTQEIRVASDGDGPFKWLFGGFFLDHKRDSTLQLNVPGAGAFFGVIGFPSDNLFDAAIRTPNREMAVFGEVSYQLTPRLEATAGVRVFRNSGSYAEESHGLFNRGDSKSQTSTKESAATPRFILAWHPSDDVMIYGQTAKGYRVGQPNPVIPPDPVTGENRTMAYKADSLWNYEIGVKSQLFDRTLEINAAAFYIDWKDIQLNQNTPDNFLLIRNGGKARSQGVELSIAWRPSADWDLSTSGALIDAELREDAPGVFGRKGDQLPGSARRQLTNTIQRNFTLGGNSGYMRVEYQYIGKSRSTIDYRLAQDVGDYHHVNLRAGMLFGDLEAAVFVNNLTDSDAQLTAQPTQNPPTVVRLRPRTVGLTLRGRF